MKIVGFWQSLLRCRGLQEFNVVFRVVMAVGQFVYLLFASDNMTITLEKALLQIIVYGEAQRLDL